MSKYLRAVVLLAGVGVTAHCAPPPVAPPQVEARPVAVREEPAGADSVGSSARARAVAELRRGRQLAAAGDAAGAAEAYRSAAVAVPALQGWTGLLAASAAADAGDTALVRRRLERETDPALAREVGWRHRVRALRARGDVVGAGAVAELAALAVQSAARRAEAWQLAGDAYAERGDSIRALAAYRQALRAASESQAGLRAARALASWPRVAPEDRLLAGRALLRHGGLDRGGALLRAYLASDVGGEVERARVRVELGGALFAARRYADAEAVLDPAAHRSAPASLLQARARYRRGDLAAARTALLGTAERFAREPEAAEALYILAEMDHDAGRLEQARATYRRAARSGATSEYALQAAVRAAGIGLVLRQPTTALADLEGFLALEARPAARAPALYWAGKAAAAAGDGERSRGYFAAASSADPFSFYGVAALERLGRSLADVPLARAPEMAAADATALAAAFVRYDLLHEAGFEEAALVQERLRERFAATPAALYAVAEGMIARGQPVAAALLGREIRQMQGSWDRRLLRLVYQFPFRDLVAREAARNSLDPALVAGLIRQESLFNPVAVSPVGAVGLMQVMPQTGELLARRVGLTGFKPAALREPTTNVRLGTLFLADQMRAHRTPSEVFAAYNAGPGRVQRWRSFPESADEDLWMERIPYAETRDYVRKVRYHTHVYRLLYSTTDRSTS